MDSISSIIYQRDIPNFFYFKNTGKYKYENIKFYVDSLLDDDKIDMTERDDQYINVALYHGSIKGWKNLRGFVASTGENHLENFSGMDYLLLGDIHLFQYMSTENPVAAYSSSLISQNFHEIDKNHGYLLWDLEQKKQVYVPIDNEARYQLVEISENDTLFTDQVEYGIDNVKIAPKGHVKIISNTNEIKSRHIFDFLKRKFSQASFCFETRVTKKGKKEEDLSEVEESEFHSIEQFIQRQVEEEHVEEITKMIQSLFQNHQPASNTIQYELLEIEFSNMFGYGPNNKINLSNYHKTLIGIFGENTFGKSTLIDIISMLLYDKLTRYSHGMTIPKEVIHFEEKKAWGKLSLSIGKKIYTIEKIYTRNANEKISQKTKLFIMENDTIQELTGEQRNRTNRLIHEILGGFDTFLFFNTFLQQRENSFREMTSLNKKKFLNSIYGYDFLEQYEKEHKETCKQYEIEFKIYEKKQSEKTWKEFEQQYVTVSTRYEELKEKQVQKKNQLSTVEESINTLNRELIYTFSNQEQIQDAIRENKKSCQDYEKLLTKATQIEHDWKLLNYLDMISNFENDELYQYYATNKTQKTVMMEFQELVRNVEKYKTKNKELVETKLKDNYSKYSNQLNIKINHSVLQEFNVSQKDVIQKKLESYQTELMNSSQELNSLFNKLHRPFEEVSQENYNVFKKKNQNEVSQLRKQLQKINHQLLSYDNYRKFQESVDIDYYSMAYHQYKQNKIFLEFSPILAINTTKLKEWKLFVQQNSIESSNFEIEQAGIKKIEYELDQTNKMIMKLHIDSSMKVIDKKKYEHLVSKVSKPFTTNNHCFEFSSKFIKHWNHVQDIESILVDKKKEFECIKDSIQKCNGLEINENCHVCVENKIYKKLQEFRKQEKIVTNSIHKYRESKKDHVEKLETIMKENYPNDFFVQEYFTKKIDLGQFVSATKTFQEKLQLFEQETAKNKQLVENYQKYNQMKEYQKTLKTLQQKKEKKTLTIQKMYWFFENKDLISFINYQWSNQMDFDILPFLDKELKIDSEYNSIVMEKNNVSSSLDSLVHEFQVECQEWDTDLAVTLQIKTIHAKLEQKSKWDEWLTEMNNLEKVKRNDSYKNNITILEKQKKYIEIYENKKKTIEFLSSCFACSLWCSMEETRIQNYLSSNGQNITTYQTEIETCLKNTTDLNHDLQIMNQIHQYMKEKEMVAKMMTTIEYEITMLCCEMEEIQLKKTIWQDNDTKMYDLEKKIKKEKSIVSVLEKDGLPLFLLRNKIEQVEKKINEMIRPFSDKHVRFQISDDKNTAIEFGFMNGNQICSFVSGMESFILDICLKFCFSYYYIHPKSNFFIIDEKISVLDKQKLGNVEFLFQFLKSTSTNVLLISHIEQIKDFVDYNMTITKKENKSIICFH